MGLPVLLVNVGALASLEYGEVFDSYPRASYLTTWDGISSALGSEMLGVNERAMKEWIRDNAGPMPASDMPTRVADVVVELARTSSTQARGE
jgi:hypothetical protein